MIISRFTPGQRAVIARRYMAREKLKVIAFDFRTTTSTISKIALQAGCPSRRYTLRLVDVRRPDVGRGLIACRIRAGWPPELAATIPPGGLGFGRPKGGRRCYA